MVSYIISRLVVLMFGTLYPAYSSYKAVKTRNVKEYVKWMMYWIVFALFTCVETIADIFASILPFYYEAKILFIFWLISPWTKGATYLYRKFVHPTLTKREQEIDEYLAQASDKGLKAIKKVGQNGLTIAANAVMQSAMKGQTTLIDQLRNYSTYYNTSPVKQLEGVPEEPAEEVEEAREAKEQEHMILLRSEDATDTEEDEDTPHFRNQQLRESLESLDNRLREEREGLDSDYTNEQYEQERLEQERIEREHLQWEQEEQERVDRQERYKNRRLLQSTHDLPPQPPRHRKNNPSKRERNFTTSLTREEFDNASNMYSPDDEVSFRRASSLRRPYASTENLSRRPVRKHEPLVRTSSERSSARATRSSSRLTQKPSAGIQITRY